MRARSGAIHSDSEESFTKLAEISINQTGIFYDDKINRRLFSQNANNRKELPHTKSIKAKTNEGQQNKQKNLFTEFDFNIEFEAIRQEREEIQRMKQQPRKEINIGILADSPQDIMDHLCVAFGLTVQRQCCVRGVNLIVNIVGLTTYKYWVFHRQTLQLGKSPLLQLYLRHCSVVLDVFHQEVNIIRCSMRGMDEIEQTLMANLIY